MISLYSHNIYYGKYMYLRGGCDEGFQVSLRLLAGAGSAVLFIRETFCKRKWLVSEPAAIM
jgi:hypothetical protein